MATDMRAGYRPAAEPNAVVGAILLYGKGWRSQGLPIGSGSRLNTLRDKANHASCSGLAADVEPAGPKAGDQMFR